MEQRFVRLYGDPSPIFVKTAPELAGRRAAEILDGDLAEAWGDRFQRVLRGEILALRERRGSTTWSITLFPLRQAGVIRCVAGHAQEAAAWAKAEQQLRYTVLSALKVQEFERAALSRFLHDSVGQNLTALGLQLDLIRMDLEEISPENCARTVEIQKLLEEMMEKVREYSYELNPATVERAGLHLALDRMVKRTRPYFSGVLRLFMEPSLKIEKKIASSFYQIAQEAVRNALQHASCSAIEIAVKSSRAGILLEVKDNGRGFDPGDLAGGRRGLGLLTMEHYASEADLDLSITSQHGQGTLVRAAEPGTG
jgi:signal transduction histidine kinase